MYSKEKNNQEGTILKIIFESHGTTLDNEAHLSSGWFDVELSELGKKQAEELGKRHKMTILPPFFVLIFNGRIVRVKLHFKAGMFR
jgi:alpha-ribazole phosphatase/probable phosphoglycerate mutase